MPRIDRIIVNLSDNFQILENMIAQDDIEKVDIRFPRGILRKARYFRTRLSFIEDTTFKRNLSYHLQLSDVHHWLLSRFDISLTVQEMIIKEGICLFGNITGSIVIHLANRIEPSRSNRGFDGSLKLLVRNGIISVKLRKDLEWLYGIRCKEHINTLRDMEFRKYTSGQYNKAAEIFRDLELELEAAKKAGIIQFS